MTSENVGIGLSFEEKLRLSLSVELEQDGGSPSHFLDLLARAIEEEIWNDLDDIADFGQLIESPKPRGLGTTRKAVMVLLSPEIKHRDEDRSAETRRRMEFVRRRARELLTPELGEANTPGPGRGNKNNGGPPLFYGGKNDTTYIQARLKRDHPDLAERVFTSELSPHKAGQIAGFIKPRQKFVPGDVKQTMGALQRHYDDEGYELLQGAMMPGDVDRAARAIRKRFQGGELERLIELLKETN